MARIKFTAGRVNAHQCADGVTQSFLWDSTAPGLGLRATPYTGESRDAPVSYVFQSKLNGKTLRITIGDRRVWTIDAAQAEARRLKVLIDDGLDPRQVKAEQQAAQVATNEAAAATIVRESITLADVWPEYVAERTPHWGDHHIESHRAMIQPGGEKCRRSSKLTESGPLASLAGVRLVDLTAERLEEWAKVEAKVRASSGRLAMRLLKACMNWCAAHKTYSAIVKTNPTMSSKMRETLGKPKVKYDLLQREQLGSWFGAVRKIGNPVIAAYLQTLLLTGARREELAGLRWADVDFQWNSMKMGDKVEDFRMVPLTPYVAHLLAALPRRNEWVFSSPAAESGRLSEPRIAHNEAVAIAGLPHLTLHGLRRSFATLSEWIEMPAGIAAQIQGHAPQGVREQNYIRRPLDLLRMWHVKIEAWMLEQAGIQFQPAPAGLRVVAV
ncbi:MAG: tyrosine-type recombinase/integrase [Sphingomonadaceae bacterium]